MKRSEPSFFTIDRNTVLLKIIFVFKFSVGGFLSIFLPIFFQQDLHMSQDQLGILYGVLPFATLIGSPLFGLLADKFNAKVFIVVCSIIQAMFLATLLVIQIYQNDLGSDGTFLLTSVTAFLSSLFGAPTSSLLDSITYQMVAHPDDYSFNRAFGALGYGIGAGVCGLYAYLVQINGNWFHFALGGGAQLISLVLMMYLPSLRAEPLTVGANVRPSQTSSLLNDTDDETLAANSVENVDIYFDGSSRTFREREETLTDTLVATHIASLSLMARLRMLPFTLPVVVFFLVVFLIGMAMGTVNAFLFLFIETLLPANFPEGSAQLLMGISVTVTTFSEVPCFFLSKKALSKVGTNGMLALSLFAYSLRFLIYSLLSMAPSAWYILFAEALHGVSFAFMWAAAFLQAQEYVKGMGLESTMSGLLSAVLKGGAGAGSTIAGFIVTSYGFTLLWRGESILACGLAVLWTCTSLMYRKSNRSNFENQINR